jgi:four helix bundle protein
MNTSYKSSRKPDLEDRTLKFASDIVGFIEQIPRSIPNNEIAKQVVRSAGSVGANYIEANEALGKKDFLLRLRICRKEEKETAYWLKLILVSDVFND